MIEPGVVGNEELIVTLSVRAALCPHPFTAFTLMLPPEVPAVTFIELPVDDPDHPDGNIHK